MIQYSLVSLSHTSPVTASKGQYSVVFGSETKIPGLNVLVEAFLKRKGNSTRFVYFV
jgi:hypothetical protein